MKTLLFVMLLSLSSHATDLQQIYNIIKHVETNNREYAVGDNGKAYGVVQIHKICVDDVNRIYNTKYQHQDAFNVVCAKEIFNLYLTAGRVLYISKHKREPTEQDLVRMWNGGLYTGHLRHTTYKYWLKYKQYKNSLSLWNNIKDNNMAVVYLHLTKENQPFYVGIGRNISRAFDFKSRSDFWKRTFKKYGIKVQILHKKVKWSEACKLEKELIRFYGRRDLKTGTLVNLTPGGEGVIGNSLSYEQKLHLRNINLGKKHKESSKLKLSKSVQQFNLNGDLIETYTSMKQAQELTGVNFRGISEVCRGNRKTAGGFFWKYK